MNTIDGWRKTSGGHWTHPRLNQESRTGRAVLMTFEEAFIKQLDWDFADQAIREACDVSAD